MDVVAAVEPLFRISRLFGLSTVDQHLAPKRKISLMSWSILVVNGFLQFADWYHFIQLEVSGDLQIWIERYPHDSPVITFNCFCTALIVLFYDKVICNQLIKLRYFNRKWFPIDHRELRHFHRMIKVLINCCVTFSVLFIAVNGFWWWYMSHTTCFLRYLLYCVGLFAHFSSYAIISCQIVTYYLLISLWCRTINNVICGARHINRKNLKMKIRLIMEADMLIKDFNDCLTIVYSPFLLLSCAVVLIECIHAAVYLVLKPGIKIYEATATVLFVVIMVTQICFFIVASTAARKEAEKIPLFAHDLLTKNYHPEVLEEIEIFSLQLFHRNMDFTACGFFKLDYTLLHGMIGTVTVYIVMLVQYE